MERALAVNISDIFTPAQQFSTFGDLTNVIVRNAFMLAGVISFVLLIFGGFSIILGAGSSDTKRIDQGKQAMVGAVFGLLIVVTSVWIIQILEAITGMRLLSP